MKSQVTDAISADEPKLVLHGSEYYVLTFYPTILKDEAINVAVVGVDGDGVVMRQLSERGWARVAAFVGTQVADVARTYVRGLLDAATNEHAVKQLVRATAPGPYTTVAMLQRGSSIHSATVEFEHMYQWYCGLAEGAADA